MTLQLHGFRFERLRLTYWTRERRRTKKFLIEQEEKSERIIYLHNKNFDFF